MNANQKRPIITVVVGRFEDIVNRGLRALIDEDKSLELVAVGIPCERLSATFTAYRPDVAIVTSGALIRAAKIRALHEKFPETHLLVLADDPTADECQELVSSGATACIAKSSDARDVLQAIHLASRGLHLLPATEPGA